MKTLISCLNEVEAHLFRLQKVSEQNHPTELPGYLKIRKSRSGKLYYYHVLWDPDTGKKKYVYLSRDKKSSPIASAPSLTISMNAVSHSKMAPMSTPISHFMIPKMIVNFTGSTWA